MIVEQVFDETIYPNLKTYIEEHNTYSAKVVKVDVQDSNIFPIIPVQLLPDITNRYNNLNYGEETYSFGIEINIYAIDKTMQQTVVNNGVSSVVNKKVSKKTICDEITEMIVNYIKETYHFTVKVTHNAPNADSNVYRNLIRLNGVLDTKYGNNNLVIYPTLR